MASPSPSQRASRTTLKRKNKRTARLRFRKMTARQSADAKALLQTFLREDQYYLDSSAAYGAQVQRFDDISFLL
jgi:hypothetical protein